MTRLSEPAGYPDHLVIRRVSSRVVYQNRWITVREDQVEFPDGSRGIYSVIDKPDFALVVPAENGGFHLVEQFRYPTGRRSWEFPQGSYPDGRDGDPEQMARDELREETGLHADHLHHLGHLHGAHGMSSQGFHVYLATGLHPGPADRETTEQDMRQTWMSRTDFDALVRDGAITDDATLAAYTLFLLHERQ